MPGPAKRSNAHKKATMSRKVHTGEDLAPELLLAVPAVPVFFEKMPHAMDEWQRVCTLLIEQQILTAWDLPTIKLLCLEWERYILAVQDIAINGETLMTSTGYEQIRPSSTIRNKSFANYSQLLQRVGGDVVARARMKRIRPKKEVTNPFESV